jgi:phenylpropionate dioxygenase-like ring-hydroxylating dioxygenase large terminal subunit
MQQSSGRPFGDYVHVETGTVDRVIFSDRAIYERELEQIFARAWNFMCHESQIPNKGDFFLSYIGEESVICTRDKTGALQVFLNTCRHRGNAVCRAESGNARSFLCTYHGWTFGLDGKLIGVPGYKDLYHEDLDREQWGLISAGKVQSYMGFIFATLDPDAVDLDEYLGEVGKIGLGLCAARGNMVAVDGVQKNVIGCNWKLAVDNLFDFYHVQISHASALLTGFGRSPNPLSYRVVLGEYGHAIGGSVMPLDELAEGNAEAAKGTVPLIRDQRWRDTPTAQEALSEAGYNLIGQPNIFPNLWITGGGTQLSLRLPKGPDSTEIWWFTMIDTNLDAEQRAARMHSTNHVFGPAGMLEQDDGENWDQSTRQTKGVVARRYPLNFSMNLGRGAPTQAKRGPNYIDVAINEHGQLWTYRAWAEWMDAESWASLKQHRRGAPTEAV